MMVESFNFIWPLFGMGGKANSLVCLFVCLDYPESNSPAILSETLSSINLLINILILLKK